MIQKNTEWNPSFFVRSMILRVGTVAYLSFAQITTLCVLNVFNVWILFGWMSFSRVMTGDMFPFFLFCCKNGFQFYPIFTNTVFWTLVFLCSCILIFFPPSPTCFGCPGGGSLWCSTTLVTRLYDHSRISCFAPACGDHSNKGGLKFSSQCLCEKSLEGRVQRYFSLKIT